MGDWLTSNPIADMYGPHFLLFYATVSVIVVVLVHLYQKGLEPGAGQPLPKIPPDVDPYQIAMMRGGEAEMARTAVFALEHRGWLEVDRDAARTVLRQSTQIPEGDHLHAAEEAVLRVFARPMDANDVRSGKALQAAVAPIAARYRARLEETGMMIAPAVRERQASARRVAIAFMLALAAYKLGIAWSRGFTNIGFGVILALAVAFLLSCMGYKQDLTARGRSFLQRLELTFGPLRARLAGGGPALGPGDGREATLVAATFGMAALWGTPWMRVPEIAGVPPVRAAAGGDGGSSTSTTSACSSSSDSGSSSDGGGSSCGGGGCGGGGCGGCGS